MSAAHRFRKRPVVIEAVRFTGDNWRECCAFLGDDEYPEDTDTPLFLDIHTLEGTMTCDLGDWIIRGIKGECYPCKPDVFAETYEPVE
jgi:hypothetical protein